MRRVLLYGFLIIASRIPGVAKEAKEPAWIEVRSPQFIVFSDGSEKQARSTAARFEEFRALIQQVLPRLRVDSGHPLIILAARDEDSLRRLLPQFWEQKELARPSGIFVSGPEKYYVALRLDAAGEYPYQAVYHEYVHMLMRLNFRELPLWLNEGLAEFFGHATLAGRDSGLGRPSNLQLRLLRESRMLPLDVLMAADHDSPHYREADKTPLFYAQCWALTHYFMIGDKGEHADQLLSFLDLVLKDTDPSTAAVSAFGDLAQLGQRLEQYIGQLSFYFLRVPLKLGIDSGRFRLRSVDAAERLALEGDFHVHMQRFAEAKAALDEALQLDPQNASAHESMGFYYLSQNDSARALPHFVAAVRLNSTSYLAHFYAARAAWDAGGEVNPEAIKTHLRRTIELNPRFVPAYVNLSRLLAGRDGNFEEALSLARKASELEPGVLQHHLDVARILLRMNQAEAASKLAERIRASAGSRADRSAAESLLAEIQRHEQNLTESRRAGETERPLRQQERGVAGAAAGPDPSKAAEGRPPDAAQAPATLEGVVREVVCSWPSEMVVTVESGGKRYRLRTENLFSVRYSAIGGSGGSDLQPCEDLSGKQVRVEFVLTPEGEYHGVIQGIGIRR